MDKKIRLTLIISTVVVFLVSAFVYVKQHNELKVKYDAAVAAAEAGDYVTARERISLIGEYKNSETLLEEYTNEIEYQMAFDFINEKKYDDALAILERLNSQSSGYKESGDLQDSVEYARAMYLAQNGQLNAAYEGYKRLPTSYLDVPERIAEISRAITFVDKWFCKEHAIDLEITATVSPENITYLRAEMKDRNGFLLGTEDNKLTGEGLVLMEDRFVWNLLGDQTRFAVIMEDNKLKIAKQPVVDNNYIVTFVRKLSTYNPIDGDINAAINRDIDGGLAKKKK